MCHGSAFFVTFTFTAVYSILGVQVFIVLIFGRGGSQVLDTRWNY